MITSVGELMLSYAKLGLGDWRAADPLLKTRARKCLSGLLAEDDGQLGVTLGARGAAMEKLKFIPMPTRNVIRDVERGFFVPLQRLEGGETILTLYLVFLVRHEHCLSLRLEAAHATGQSHDYGHIQMTRDVLGLIIPTPDWIPVSYPAFPSSTSDPVDMVLFMMTAVHGHSGAGGVLEMLTDIFRARSRPNDARECADRLTALLGLG